MKYLRKIKKYKKEPNNEIVYPFYENASVAYRNPPPPNSVVKLKI